jgi:hypothetical protein
MGGERKSEQRRKQEKRAQWEEKQEMGGVWALMLENAVVRYEYVPGGGPGPRWQAVDKIAYLPSTYYS